MFEDDINILYLHGAGASPLSFVWLRELLPNHLGFAVQMDHTESVKANSTKILDLIENKSNLTIIAHSLGGLVAIELAAHPNVKQIVTLSSPFGGHPAATIMSMWSNVPMFKDLSPFGSTVKGLQKKWNANSKPHLAIVTTSGLPIIGHQNDGVVTVASQMALKGPQYKHLNLNHFEVLLSQQTMDIIKDFVFCSLKMLPPLCG